MSALPVRLTPRAGEPLTAYAVRLGDANGIRPGLILPRHRRDVGVSVDELEAVANLSGMDTSDTARLTMDRYPPTIRGLGPTHRGGWRLHFSVEWACPRCTALTGHCELLWQTALSPVCRACRLLLVPTRRLAQGGPPTESLMELMELADELADLAEASVTRHSARVRLGMFRRLSAVIAQTVDDQWPERPTNLPPLDVDAAREWGAFPSSDPGTVAVILSAAAPALHSTSHRDRLAREGYLRRRGGSSLAVPPRHVPNPGRYLPRRPPALPTAAPILCGFNAEDARRLRWLLAQLTHEVRRYGLTPDHVSALLPAPGENGLPEPDEWRTRWQSAIALHMLLSQIHGGAASSARACHAFGTTDDSTSKLLDGVRLGRGIHALDATRLTDGARGLIENGLVDYHRRRDTLRPITRLPRIAVSARRLPEVEEFAGASLAFNWIWTRLTHGPSWTSPRPFIADRHVRAFEAAIDPETRLALVEAGQQLLADTDLLTIPTMTATFDAVIRSYG